MAKQKRFNRNSVQSATLRDDEIPNPIVVKPEDPFEDPRGGTDRRQKDDPDKIPATGCRRVNERRTMVYIKNDDWWMKRNYNNTK